MILQQINEIRIRLGDVNSSTHIDFHVRNNDKDPKSEVGDKVRISKCKDIFTKSNAPNQSEEVFVIQNVKIIVPWRCITAKKAHHNTKQKILLKD